MDLRPPAWHLLLTLAHPPTETFELNGELL